MKFKLVVAAVSLAALGGVGLGVRTYLHDTDPAVKAGRLTSEGKLRDALVELRNATRTSPRDAELHVRTGRLLSRLADPVAAEREFRTALQLGADRTALAPDLGEAILVQGRFRDVLREVPARAPAGSQAVLAKSLLLRAVAQLSLDDLSAAEATLADAQARAPGQPEVALIGARLAAARNDLPLMRTLVAEVLRLDPDQVEALLMQEKLKTVEGDRKEALALADRAVTAAPWSAMARIERANQLIFFNEDKKAQADVNAVLQSQPRFMDAVYLNGILMARRGQLAEAAIQLEKLDSVAGRIPQGLYYQSLIALQQGNLQTAADFARRYNALVPQDPEGLKALGRIELALNRPAAALPPLVRLAADSPPDAEALDMLGRAHAALNQGAEAARAFEAAIALAPDNALFRYHLGAQQRQTGRAREALGNLDKAFAADPKIAGLGLALVEANLAAGEPAQAESAITRVRAATGDTEELTLLAATARLRQNDLPGGRAVLTEGIRKYPNATDLRVQLAVVLAQEGRQGDALTILMAVLAKEPAKLSALSAYIDMRAAENDLPAANRMLEAAHKAAPRNPTITSMLADGLVAAKEPQRAVDMIRDSGADTALPPLVGGALGRAQIAMGRAEEAKATYRALLAEHPDDLMLRGALAALLTAQRDFAGVQALLRDALAIYPGSYSLMSGLVANAARWQGLEEGVRTAEALRAQPDTMPGSAELKGDLFMAANRPAEGAQAYVAEFEKGRSLPLLMKASGALAISNQLEPATRMLTAWLRDHPEDIEAAQRLAQLDLQAGRYAAAQTNLGIVLAAQPGNAMALNNLAWSYLMVGDKRALPTAQRAYLQDPAPLAADTLGWILVRNGSARAAVPLLQRAVEQRPDAATRYHLAVALSDDGRADEALKALAPLLDGPAFADQGAARALAEELRRK